MTFLEKLLFGNIQPNKKKSMQKLDWGFDSVKIIQEVGFDEFIRESVAQGHLKYDEVQELAHAIISSLVKEDAFELCIFIQKEIDKYITKWNIPKLYFEL